MTANPLLAPRRQAHPGIGQHGQPMDVDGYVAWLNANPVSAKLGWTWSAVTTGNGRREVVRRDGTAREDQSPHRVDPRPHWSETGAA